MKQICSLVCSNVQILKLPNLKHMYLGVLVLGKTDEYKPVAPERFLNRGG